jgi:hypothetical protein
MRALPQEKASLLTDIPNDTSALIQLLVHTIRASVEDIPASLTFDGSEFLDELYLKAASKMDLEITGDEEKLAISLGVLSIIPAELTVEQEPNEKLHIFVARAANAVHDLARMLNLWVDKR